MEQLRLIGTENDRLVMASEAGERFALPLDDVLRAELRRARREQNAAGDRNRPSPRDIQAHIRAGLSTEEVAELLGARVEDVQRFEGPVLAEREHIVGQALAVPVLVAGDFDSNAQPTFGEAVRAKLSEAGAIGERWTSWKEQTGWVVKLEFTAAEVDHDARWGFDARSSTLTPGNADAVQLSRQGSLPEGLIPRLRALDTAEEKDDSTFDTGSFDDRRDAGVDDPADTAAAPDLAIAPTPAQEAAIKRREEPVSTSAETADLLEALRRRRGQREPLPGLDAEETAPRHAPVALFDALEPGYEPTAETPVEEEETPPAPVAVEAGRRKGRTSMPSWDEIVFGARTEE